MKRNSEQDEHYYALLHSPHVQAPSTLNALRALLALFLLVTTTVCFGQNITFKDDFSGYPDGAPPATDWEVLAGKWQIAGKQLTASTREGFCQLRKVPVLDSFDYVARITIKERAASSGQFATAGITVSQDKVNHWRLNFVEGPDKSRYLELGETLEGVWEAQSQGSTALRRGEWTGGKWEYGKAYSMRLKLSPVDIYAEVKETDTGRIIGKFRYLWDDKDGVRFGRPGFSDNGFSVACTSVSVTAEKASQPGTGIAMEAGKAGRVALVRDFPAADNSLLDTLSAALQKSGFGVTTLSDKEFASSAVLSPMTFDYVVLAGNQCFPLAAKKSFLRFLRGGGHCVVLGGNVFEESAVRLNGRWLSQSDFDQELAKTKPERELLAPTRDGGRDWWANADVPQPGNVAVVEAAPAGKSIRFDIKGFNGWSTFSRTILPFQQGQSLLCFRAKGDATTSQITVELDEKDGSRWIAVVDLKPQWEPFVLGPKHFAAWESKALTKHELTPTNAVRIAFGIAQGFTPRVAKGDHCFWVDSIGTASNRLGAVDFSEKVALNFFYDYEPYRLADVASVGISPQNDVTGPVAPLKGAFGGLSAVGFAYPNESKFIPLLSAFDTEGRDRGWAAGMLVNYAGSYSGSSWIFFGITNRDFYTQPAVLATLTGAMKAAKGDLVQKAEKANARRKMAALPLVSPAPRGFIRLSADGKHLVYPNGRRFFMSGCNYVGPFDMCGGRLWRDDYFNVASVEEDFRKAHQAGINCIRYWVSSIDSDIQKGDFRKTDAIRECARRYGIYLLLDLPGTQYRTVEEMAASHKAIASAFKDEPMVLGYDLRNEPGLGDLASIQYPEGAKPAVLTRDLLQKQPDRLDPKYITQIEAERPDWLRLSSTVKGQEARNAIAAVLLWSKYTKKHNLASATIPGMVNCLPEEEETKDVVAVVNETFALWIRQQIEAIRSVDTNHLITVGYDSVFSCLPTSGQLDFISQHVYARPYSLNNVMENVTALDRLAAVWPGKPITLGEFGYSTGVPMDQGYLDRYTASVGEMLHYLYAFSKNYDGVKKWMLNDWPYKIMTHYGDWNRGEITRRYEERFGIYYYDGTAQGRPKPIAYALRFFGDYLRQVEPSGTLDINPAQLSIGAGYVYRNKNALFVGNTTYSSPNLEFSARHPANVLLTWDEKTLRLMSSADARVKVRPAAFGKFGAKVTGKYSSMKTEGGALVIDMLEGETLRLK